MNSFYVSDSFLYQKNHTYFAQCRHGIENIVADELKELGASDIIPGFSGVQFKASKEIFYSISYSAKTTSRILAPLRMFPIDDDKMLYEKTLNIEWENIFDVKNLFSVSASVSDSIITHSHFAILRIKDAIADRFRIKSGKRPDIDKDRPDIRINLNLRKNIARISIDASGDSMHKRGYRKEKVLAPLNETLAAAIIRISGWEGKIPLYDPMAGSGTLLAEGILKFKQLPSGFKREKFGFFFLPDFDKKLWEKVKNRIDSNVKYLPEFTISGSDIDKNSVRASKKNLSEIPDGNNAKVERKDFRDISSINNSMIISNLPYGQRMNRDIDMERLYKEFGDFLKKKCTGSKAFLLCGSTSLVKNIGLRTKRKIQFFNGPIETRLIELDLF